MKLVSIILQTLPHRAASIFSTACGRSAQELIVENMSTSGEHGNDPGNFVDLALGVANGVGRIEAYYFCMRMEANPKVEASFQPFIDSAKTKIVIVKRVSRYEFPVVPAY
jgi:hypothetical protein